MRPASPPLPPALPDLTAIDWTWSIGIFQSPSLSAIFLGPLLFLLVAAAAVSFLADDCSQCGTSFHALRAIGWEQLNTIPRRFRNGLRVDLGHVPPVEQLVAAASSTRSSSEAGEGRLDRRIGPNSVLTERDIRSNYSSEAVLPDGDGSLADAAVLLLRLACLLVGNGQCTVEAELLLASVCRRLSLEGAVIDIGHREIRAQLLPTGENAQSTPR